MMHRRGTEGTEIFFLFLRRETTAKEKLSASIDKQTTYEGI